MCRSQWGDRGQDGSGKLKLITKPWSVDFKAKYQSVRLQVTREVPVRHTVVRHTAPLAVTCQYNLSAFTRRTPVGHINVDTG